MNTRIRTFLDAVHGSRWARIIPLCVIGLIYAVSMIVWHPDNAADWFKPLFINAMAAGGMYFASRFSSGSSGYKDIGNLCFTVFSVIGTLMILTMRPFAFQGEFNPGLGAGPSLFLGISLYHRYRMNKDC